MAIFKESKLNRLSEELLLNTSVDPLFYSHDDFIQRTTCFIIRSECNNNKKVFKDLEIH